MAFRLLRLGISTHALHEEGDAGALPTALRRHISTHALHEEGDLTSFGVFLGHQKISTHALHEEGD